MPPQPDYLQFWVKFRHKSVQVLESGSSTYSFTSKCLHMSICINNRQCSHWRERKGENVTTEDPEKSCEVLQMLPDTSDKYLLKYFPCWWVGDVFVILLLFCFDLNLKENSACLKLVTNTHKMGINYKEPGWLKLVSNCREATLTHRISCQQ